MGQTAYKFQDDTFKPNHSNYHIKCEWPKSPNKGEIIISDKKVRTTCCLLYM